MYMYTLHKICNQRDHSSTSPSRVRKPTFLITSPGHDQECTSGPSEKNFSNPSTPHGKSPHPSFPTQPVHHDSPHPLRVPSSRASPPLAPNRPCPVPYTTGICRNEHTHPTTPEPLKTGFFPFFMLPNRVGIVRRDVAEQPMAK